MAYIVISKDSDGSEIDPAIVLPVDTDEQRAAAKVAIREHGLTFERVSVGDPDDPDSYQTTQRLYA